MIAIDSVAPPEGRQVVVWGWGARAAGTLHSDALYQAPVVVRSPVVCAAQKYIENGYALVGDPATMIAAGGQSARGITRRAGVCEGDSGGGLIVKDAAGHWKLAGIASWQARDCGQADGTPDVFVSVPAFREWINDTIATGP